MLAVKLVNPAHQFQIRFADRTRLVIGARPADAHQPGLLCHRQGVIAIDHRLTPSSPALLSATSKKSFSSVNCPIFACSTFTSIGGATELALPPSNTSGTRSCNCFFQSVIWFGWTSNCWASSASVLSPLRAASATFALNAGECARRFRFVIFWFLVAGHYDRLTPQLFHLTNCPNSRRHLFGFVSSSSGSLLPAIMTDSRPSFST